MIYRRLLTGNVVLILSFLFAIPPAQTGACSDDRMANELIRAITLLADLSGASNGQVREQLLRLGQDCYPSFFSFVLVPTTVPTTAPITPPTTTPMTVPTTVPTDSAPALVPTSTPAVPSEVSSHEPAVGSDIFAHREISRYDTAVATTPLGFKLPICRPMRIVANEGQRYLVESISFFKSETDPVTGERRTIVQGWMLTDAFAEALNTISVTDAAHIQAGSFGYNTQSKEDVAYNFNLLIQQVPFVLGSGTIQDQGTGNELGGILGWVPFTPELGGQSAYLFPHSVAPALIGKSLVTTYTRTGVRSGSEVVANVDPISVLPPDSVVHVEGHSDDWRWLLVEARERKWVNKTDVTPRLFREGETVEVFFDSLNVREDHSVDATISGEVTRGNRLFVMQVSPDNQWIRVSAVTGAATPTPAPIGWISTCGVTTPQVSTGDSANQN